MVGPEEYSAQGAKTKIMAPARQASSPNKAHKNIRYGPGRPARSPLQQQRRFTSCRPWLAVSPGTMHTGFQICIYTTLNRAIHDTYKNKKKNEGRHPATNYDMKTNISITHARCLANARIRYRSLSKHR
jgi:hypothetical protein